MKFQPYTRRLVLALSASLVCGISSAATFEYRIPFKGAAKAVGPSFSYRDAEGAKISAVQFPEVAVGASSEVQHVSLSNTGKSSITFTAEAQATPPFKVVASNCTGELPVDQACDIELAFQPNEAGDFSAGYSLSITANIPIADLPLRGISTVPRIAAISTTGSLFAQMTDGSWRVTGMDSNGQLGLGGATSYSNFSVVPSLSGALRVVGSSRTTFAEFPGGRWAAAGLNGSGQLGLGNTENQPQFTWVPALAGATEVHPSQAFTVAKLANGTWVGAGANNVGQLGLGPGVQAAPVFTPIPGLDGASTVRVGSAASFGRFASGAWVGSGAGSALGRGTTTTFTHTVIPEIQGALQLVTTPDKGVTLAQLANGSWVFAGVATWGSSSTFVSLPALQGATTVFSAQNLTWAKFPGDVWKAAGDTSLMGLGEYTGMLTTFQQMPHINGAVTVTAAACSSIAKMPSGEYLTTGSCIGRGVAETPGLRFGLVK